MASEIELQVDAGTSPGMYTTRVLRAASGGEPTAVMRLDVDELLENRDALEKSVLLSTVSARRALPVEEEQLRAVGRQLFEFLFTGPINSVYRASLMVAQQEGERLRIVLRLNAPELAALPWEALWDPEVGTYTCMREPLVRHVPAPYTLDPLAVEPPLRILGIAASPRGLPELDVDAEREHLLEALALPLSEGLIELHWLSQATWQAVHAKLLSGHWHVLHFVGHGDFDIDAEQGRIALVGPDGRKDLVEAERLATLLGEAEPTPRLVVLNSCSSGEEGAADLFSGTAAALARSGISAVAAMQFTVSDEAALRFARGFYTALAHGRDIAAAIRAGRIEILGAARSLEWVTPVLYLRGENTRLFDLRSVQKPPAELFGAAGPAPPKAEELQSERPSRPDVLTAQAHAIYLQARAELRAKHYDVAISLLDELDELRPSYRDGAALRSQAVAQRSLTQQYQRAGEAEVSANWLTAAEIYAEILEADPHYRDAATRRALCEKKQQVADLQSELRYHAEVLNWQAVIEVSDELGKLDPQAADVDGVASHARKMLERDRQDADLSRLYERARASELAMDWRSASRDYESILTVNAAYRDARERAEVCRGHLASMERTREVEEPKAEIAVAAVPATAPAGHQRGGTSIVGEVLGYLGGAIAVVLLGLIVAYAWPSISPTGGIVLAVAVSLLLLGAGFAVPAGRSDRARRLRAVLWGGSTAGLAAFTVGLVFEAVGTWETVDPAIVWAPAITTVYAAALWYLNRTAVQHVLTFVALMATVMGIALVMTWPSVQRPWPSGLAVWAGSLLWGLLAWLGILRSRTVGLLVASWGLLEGSAVVADESWGPYLAVATALGIVVLAVVERSIPLLVPVALATLLVVPWVLIGVPVLIGATIYIAHRCRAEGRDWLGRHRAPTQHLATPGQPPAAA